jgi:hypothetical protein
MTGKRNPIALAIHRKDGKGDFPRMTDLVNEGDPPVVFGPNGVGDDLGWFVWAAEGQVLVVDLHGFASLVVGAARGEA